MPATTGAAARRWQDLPPDVLREISRRLNTAVDLVRFHGVCKPWRSTFDDGGFRALPWLLAPSASRGAADQDCRCVFSRTSYRAPGICVCDRRVACADGTAAWLMICDKQQDWLVNPLTAARLPVSLGDSRRTNGWLDHKVHTHRVVSGDGTILLYGFDPLELHGYYHGFKGLTLKPGHKEWRRVHVHAVRSRRCCAVVADKGTVYAMDQEYCYVLRPSRNNYMTGLPDEPGKVRRRCSYLLEFRGEMLLVSVLQVIDGWTSSDLSVSFYSMDLDKAESHHDDDDEAPTAWVRRDDAVSLLVDHVLFLGFPSSFAVEATRFGGGDVSGGTAYFVLDPSAGPCDVYRHDFRLAKTTVLVETLPDGWNDERCMWFLPQPNIAPIAARETAPHQPRAPTASSGTHRRQLRIYVGNLPPNVDNSRLREMFSKHGKVASAKVAYDKKGRSRGFGFVTMATQDGFDKAIAAGNGAVRVLGPKQTTA